MNATRRKAEPKPEPSVAAPRTVVGTSSAGDYVPKWGPSRPGQDDALALPSRMGNRLVYRDGRVKEL